jgi:prepilin-type N-terminal cleavage/methylation domain-containing protein
MNSRAGLTLVELIVVLVVLAALAGTAITATAGLVEEARYDAANRTLLAIEEGIVGRSDRADPSGTPWITGFVADMGRLPKVVDTDPSRALAELWEQPVGSTLSSVQTLTAVDPEVRLVAGWRGPYVRLPFGATSLLTGESIPPATPPPPVNGDPGYFEFQRADGTLAVMGEAIASVWTLGADGESAGTGYDLDRSVTIESTVGSVAKHKGSFSVRVVMPEGVVAGGDRFVVRLFGPSATSEGAVVVIEEQVFDLAAQGLSTPPLEIPFTFTAVTIGHRAVRAYRTTESAPFDVNAPLPGVTVKSRVASVAVARGGAPDVRLVLEAQ